MKSNLVIVESPAKAKTIEKYLGKDFIVRASIGHIKDLPKSKLGVDVDNNFMPTYEVIKGKTKVIAEIKKLALTADCVYLAPDPDREGEAIAWHVAEEIKKIKKPPMIRRVLFNEITKNAIREAINQPQELNLNMFEAQQARRILDRLVGYQISPILWEKVRRGLSAGRVQSVAVRLVCEREEAIRNFTAQEYWYLEVELTGGMKPSFIARLSKCHDKKIDLKNKDETTSLISALEKASFVLTEIQKKEQKRHPSPPFITSKLQQEAARKLGFTAKKTMMLAQHLYEGVDVGDEVVGLITYMRTDSTRVAGSAIQDVRAYIEKTYGADYFPEKPNFYQSKKGAQDAHEAIRPTSTKYSPEFLKKYLKKDEHRLYELIWKRFVASQMSSAIFDRTTFIIHAGECEFRANGSILKFPGFIAVYMEGLDEGEDPDQDKTLPALSQGEALVRERWVPSQHFTEPPPRFTEASLVKELEEKGIGRPSTYASILSVIRDKKYTEMMEKKFRPTDLGILVNNLLVAHFPRVIDVEFTARMEEALDEVEEGKLPWHEVLKDFYKTFSETLKQAKIEMKDVKRQEIKTDIMCEKCGQAMVIKFGRHGEFLACVNYPDCKNTKEFKKDEAGQIQIQRNDTDEKCEKCGSPMVIKTGRFGRFMACSAYPECKSTKAISIGVNCPKCAKPLTARRSKRGKVFYGCTAYPKCDFASWNKPINEKCPECNSPFLVEKYTKMQGVEIACPEKECSFKK